MDFKNDERFFDFFIAQIAVRQSWADLIAIALKYQADSAEEIEVSFLFMLDAHSKL